MSDRHNQRVLPRRVAGSERDSEPLRNFAQLRSLGDDAEMRVADGGCRSIRRGVSGVLTPVEKATCAGAICDPLGQVVFAIQWWWSLRRLWVAAVSRHSDRAADLPLRMNLSMRRLYLICPNTGSIVACRCW